MKISISFRSLGSKLISPIEILFLSTDKYESELRKLTLSLYLSSIKSSNFDFFSKLLLFSLILILFALSELFEFSVISNLFFLFFLFFIFLPKKLFKSSFFSVYCKKSK